MDDVSKPRIVVTPPGPKAREFIERDHALLSPSLSRTAPLVGVETNGVWVKDIDGNIYLDFGSGIAVANVGHHNPEVTKAIIDQVQKCDHVNSCDYYTGPQVEFAEALSNVMPLKSSKRFFFRNSGTEAVECAIKLARYHSRRHYFLGYIRSFHGRTMGSLAFTSTSNKARRHFAPMMPGAVLVSYPYCYRCPLGQSYPECDLHCLRYIEDHILKYVVSPDEIAGILLEPLLGAGGYVTPPEEYWPRVRELCDQHGILFIADEVQTGFGRTGRMWACEHWDIELDIMCMSKSVAAGLPMGVCAAKGEMMDWTEGAHENTLGGNPIIMSAALAVLRVITRDRLWENAERVGSYMHKRLKELQEKLSIIGDVRGKGLMIGVELVKDRKAKDPAVEERNRLRKTVGGKPLLAHVLEFADLYGAQVHLGQLWVFQQFFRGTLEGEPASAHQVGMVTDLQRPAGSLLYDDDRQPCGLGHLSELLEHLCDQYGHQACGRLVDEHHLRVPHEDHALRQHLAFPAAQRPGRAVHESLQHGEEGEDHLLLVLDHFGVVDGVGGHFQVLGHGEAAEYVADLWHVSNPILRPLVGGHLRNVLALEHDLAGVYGDEPHDGLEERRLAHSVGADDDGDRPFGCLEVEVVDDVDRSVAYVEAFRLYYVCHITHLGMM